jgi:hypothetical protein
MSSGIGDALSIVLIYVSNFVMTYFMFSEVMTL